MTSSIVTPAFFKAVTIPTIARATRPSGLVRSFAKFIAVEMALKAANAATADPTAAAIASKLSTTNSIAVTTLSKTTITTFKAGSRPSFNFSMIR